MGPRTNFRASTWTQSHSSIENTIVPSGMVDERNSFEESNQALGVLRERRILRLPIVEITGGKGPVIKGLIPILVEGPVVLKERTVESSSGVLPLHLLVPLVGPSPWMGSMEGVSLGHCSCRPGVWL